MDGSRFDALTMTFVSRRSGIGLGLAALLGHGATGADAKKKPKPKKCQPKCPVCKRCKNGKCKPKPNGTACGGGTCQGGNCITLACAAPDGIRNGTETGLDCGGLCPRCGNGQGCQTRDDCRSAFCANGLCQECAPGLCGGDANGPCGCTIAKGNGQFVCRTAKGVPNSACLCPPGTSCFNVMAQDGCYGLCGSP